MPQPIIPIHQQEMMPIMFGESILPEFQMSEIQSILLQPTAADRKAKKYSMSTVEALEQIDKNVDLIVTAVSSAGDRFCAVPHSIDDSTLLSLKAEGLVSGSGRSVKITERGASVLKDHYLSKTNALKDSRVSEKFDYRSFSRIASSKGIFKKS